MSNQITSEQIKQAIQKFFDERSQKDDKYSNQAEWLAKHAKKMAESLKFGTHISKGIHSSSRGDNVRFVPKNQLDGYIGSHTIESTLLDASGNAADLPLAAFFDSVVDETQNIRLRDLILNQYHALKGCFADDENLSDEYQQIFYRSLNRQIQAACTHGLNKQLLWSMSDGGYRTVIPLHPSVLVHEFYLKINELRFSENNKTARDNRFKKTAEQKKYISINNLAIVQLGGTKPQTVSQLNLKQGGRNYLLPSLPPRFTPASDLSIPKSADNLFNVRALNHRVAEQLEGLFKIIQIEHNNMNIRRARD